MLNLDLSAKCTELLKADESCPVLQFFGRLDFGKPESLICNAVKQERSPLNQLLLLGVSHSLSYMSCRF